MTLPGLVVALLIPMFSWVQDAGEQDPLIWHDARTLTLEGQAFEDTAAPFDRLPARAESTLRDAVWDLSRCSAGLSVRFQTDATTIHARWSLTNDQLAMPHMPATGVSGVDLYVRQGADWRWLGTGLPTQRVGNTALIGRDLDPAPDGRPRDYLLHLPLYNGTESLEIGVPRGYRVVPFPRPDARSRPIVFYGTSITQGACASRPGMAHTAILGRRLDRPVINMGFSGVGEMELDVMAYLLEIDAAAFVIDCLPNMNAEQVTQRTQPLVQMLRASKPDVPILLVEDRSYSDAHLRRDPRDRNRKSRAALRAAYHALQAEGVSGLHYLKGDDLLGHDGEATVDGSHPNDLGFMRHADAFEPVLRGMLAAIAVQIDSSQPKEG